MPDHESAVGALETIKETGKATFPCIRFHSQGVYLYGDLYERNSKVDHWKVGDKQQ